MTSAKFLFDQHFEKIHKLQGEADFCRKFEMKLNKFSYLHNDNIDSSSNRAIAQITSNSLSESRGRKNSIRRPRSRGKWGDEGARERKTKSFRLVNLIPKKFVKMEKADELISGGNVLGYLFSGAGVEEEKNKSRYY